MYKLGEGGMHPMSLSQDMMKYLTVKIVKSFEKKPEEQPAKREQGIRESWSERWFGVLPLTIKTLAAKGKQKMKP